MQWTNYCISNINRMTDGRTDGKAAKKYNVNSLPIIYKMSKEAFVKHEKATTAPTPKTRRGI